MDCRGTSGQIWNESLILAFACEKLSMTLSGQRLIEAEIG